MYWILLLLLVLSFTQTVQADYAVQTDWSGGSGVGGPVALWEDTFSSSTDINWSSILQINKAQRHFVFKGIYATYISLADIDGDGDGDILTNDYTAGRAVWYENNENGNSWTRHFIPAEGYYSECYQPAAGDFDADGDIDVVTSMKIGSSPYYRDLLYFENLNGSGSSWSHGIVTYQMYYPYLICLDDIDNDADEDIVETTQGIFMSWLESGENWASHNIEGYFNNTVKIGSADFDINGMQDVYNIGTSSYVVIRMNSLPDPWEVIIVDSTFTSVRDACISDIDMDGDIDLIGGSSSLGAVWWENPAIGSNSNWIRNDISSDTYICAVASGDFDGDGDFDVAGANSVVGRINWWENLDGTGSNWSEHLVYVEDFSEGVTSLACGDLNGDTISDLVVSIYQRIYWFDMTAFNDIGNLESSILELPSEPDWDCIDWNADTPDGTLVAFQVRASDDYSNMGPWSDTISTNGSLNGILEDGDSFFQYKVILSTDKPEVSPELHDVSVMWDPLTIIEEGGSETYDFVLLPISPNPNQGNVLVSFILPDIRSVQVNVYDIHGRIMYSTTPDSYDSGLHAILLEDMQPGIYFCRMTAGNFTATQSFVVIQQSTEF